ncbi:MAG: hypothetical protein RLZZ28_1874 [Bacteroidota bacterium]|jgi:GT2 family glycosyltransferase
MKKPLVSLITVNYDQPEVTADFLRSLSKLTYDNWEVIVVDNKSPGRPSAYLKKEFPFIIHVSSPENIGFAGGNNIGYHFAKGEFVFLVNNDTEVTTELLTELVAFHQSHPDCGIACPKIKYFYQPDTIQYAGAIGLHPLTSRSYDIGYLEKDDGQYNDQRKTDLPNGAAMMLSREKINQVGLMSEIFFLYYEELDWSARFKHAGYAVYYVGTAEIFHKESVSTGKNSAFKTYYLYRNRFLYIRRNYQGLRWFIAASFFVCISSPVHWMKHWLKKEKDHAKSIWKAVLWNFTNDAFKEPVINGKTILNRIIVD